MASVLGRLVSLTLLVAAAIVPATATAADEEPAPYLEWRLGQRSSQWEVKGWRTSTRRVYYFELRDAYETASSVDIRISRTPARGSKRNPWRYPASLQQIQPGPLTIEVERGTIVCLQARARSQDGPVTAFSETTLCISRAFGPGALRRLGRVDVKESPLYAYGRALVIRADGSLRLPGVPAGAQALVYASLPKELHRSLDWVMPGRRVGVVFGAGPGFERRHGVPLAFYDLPARTRGAMRLGSSGTSRSLPVEAVAIQPRWMLRMTR